MNGKGSKPRPFNVTQEEYNRRWDMIFGRDLDNDSVVHHDGEVKEDASTQVKTQQEMKLDK